MINNLYFKYLRQKILQLVGGDSSSDGTSSTARGNVALDDFEKKFLDKLDSEMKKSQMPHPKVRHNGWASIKWIPNVREFKIEVGVIDRLFQQHGIEKKTPAILEFKPHTNKSANRYIKHQFNRMDESIRHKREDIYWAIGERLLSKSTSFLVMGIQHVIPRWYKDRNMVEVFKVAKTVRRIANQTFPKLEFSRTYIPKKGTELTPGNIRPLGVPSLEWRIYLHLWNVLLSFFLEAKEALPDWQHGFRPKRGTGTAWKQILEEVIRSKRIYEIDFKGYFDSISLAGIAERLEELSIPRETVEKLIEMHRVGVKLPKKELIPEGAQKLKSFFQRHEWEFDFNIGNYNIKGVPQGAPTSPILSATILRDYLFKDFGKVVGYADDIILYDVIKEPFTTPEMKKLGIIISEPKSMWVRDNHWIKPLKFLGLEYDGNLNKLRAKTRNGATMLFDKEELIEALSARESSQKEERFYLDENPNGSWTNLITSSIFGFVMSRLYMDSWNPEVKLPIEEEWAKNSVRGSKLINKMLSKRYGVRLNMYNSSSFSCGWLKDRLTKRLRNLKLPDVAEEWKSILSVVQRTQGHSWENLTKQALETSDQATFRDRSRNKWASIIEDIPSQHPPGSYEEQIELMSKSWNSQNPSYQPTEDFKTKIIDFDYKKMAKEIIGMERKARKHYTFSKWLIANKIKTDEISAGELAKHRKAYDSSKFTRPSGFEDLSMVPLESTDIRLETVGLENNQSNLRDSGKIMIHYYGSSSNLFSANYVLWPKYLRVSKYRTISKHLRSSYLVEGIMAGIFIVINYLNWWNMQIDIRINPLYQAMMIENSIWKGVDVLWSKADKSWILSEHLKSELNVYSTKLGANPTWLVDGRTIQDNSHLLEGLKVWEIFIILGLLLIGTAYLYDKVMDTWTIVDYTNLNHELYVRNRWGENLIWPITWEEYINLEGYQQTEQWIIQLQNTEELWTAMEWMEFLIL